MAFDRLIENIVKMQNRYCSLPYLNGIAYFQFLNAYRKDFKLIINTFCESLINKFLFIHCL